MDVVMNGMIISLLIFMVLCTIVAVGSTLIKKWQIKKRFNELPIGATFIRYDEVDNPFSEDIQSAVVVEKRVNKNGKGYIKYKRPITSSYTFTETAENFFNLYRY